MKKLERLKKPKTHLEKYQDDPHEKNPLFNFNLNSVRKRQQCTLMQKLALERKYQECRKSLSPDINDDIILKPQEYYKTKLRNYVKQTAVPKMTKRIESRILNSACPRLKLKYPEIVNAYMFSVHEEFDTIMKTFSVNRIIKPAPDDLTPPKCHFKFKYNGKSEFYDKFLKNREKIRRHLFIVQPFFRHILATSRKELPQHFVDLANHRHIESTILGLKVKLLQEIQSSMLTIQRTWYPKVGKIILKHFKKRTIPQKQWEQALSCAGGLINRQLNEIKVGTIERLAQVIGDRELIPILQITGTCNESLQFSPTLQDIYGMFDEIIEEILNIGRYISPLFYLFDENAQKVIGKPRWKIEIGDVYPIEAREMIWQGISKTFSPVRTYINAMEDNFYDLYSTEAADKINKFLSVPRQFDECHDKIEELRSFIIKIRQILNKEFFDTAIIYQSQVNTDLNAIANKLMTPLVTKLFESHTEENIAICNEFEIIKGKALKHPKSTEELVESGEYILHIKNTYIEELKERIQKSLQMMGMLVELRELSPMQLSLQIKVISWLQRLKIVLEENASTFEYYKSMFEEKLLNVKNCLIVDMDEFLPELSILNDMNDDSKLRDNVNLLNNILSKIKLMEDLRDWINKEEVLFKFPCSKYPKLDDIKGFVEPFHTLIRRCIQWFRKYWVWIDGPFEHLVPNDVSNTTEDFQREFGRILKFYRSQIKGDMLRGSVCKWRGSMDDVDAENYPTPVIICQRMLQHIKDFRIGVYMISIMCNPALKERHWDEMSLIAGYDVTPDAGTTIRKLQKAGLIDLLEKFEMISISANKELQLQQNLEAMIEEWKTVTFTLSPYKETTIMILTQLDDIQCILDDHIIKTLSMRGSAFVKPCEQKVKDWYATLTRINKTLDQWGRVQSKWLYLLPIFSSKDIVSQMPEEGRLFQQVDSIYKRYMSIVAREPLVIDTAPTAGLLEAMESANTYLEDIENGVNVYLEKKRLYFPRFFFLSNDEMLEILSNTKDPLKVQPHLNKCFEGINRLKFDENLDIHSMFSIEKEEVHFLNIISTEEAKGSVEKWLLQVQGEMLLAVRDQIKKSFDAYIESKRTTWVLNWPGMVVLCVSQIFWAAEMHTRFTKTRPELIQKYFEKLIVELKDIVTLIRSEDITNLQRITIKALIVIDVHAKDVVEELIRKGVNSATDFNWLAQLRYYFEEESVDVKIITAGVKYANEYLGNSDRLVITPLTDRCYRTLMGAYQLHLNGAPEGPAGTGKTETTKDLAKALAVQCIVFNCSDSLDYKAMGKFFKGLASCGAWVCFDEFNRIELEVLSVVAQQILQIVVAVRANMKKFMFEGTELELNPACYVCITMNPGYVFC